MKRNDVTVIIAAHKPYRMPDDPLYLPMQVGASLCEADFGYAKDNTGDNISGRILSSANSPFFIGHGRIWNRITSAWFITEGTFP